MLSYFAPKTLICGIFVANVAKKTQHTRFEDKILRKVTHEDKPQVVQPCTEKIILSSCEAHLQERGPPPYRK